MCLSVIIMLLPNRHTVIQNPCMHNNRSMMILLLPRMTLRSENRQKASASDIKITIDGPGRTICGSHR